MIISPRTTWRTLCLRIPFLRPLLGMPIELVVIRHAESERNAALEGKLHVTDPSILEKAARVGDDEVDLTEKGVGQARATGTALKGMMDVPHVVINSGYVRTRRTMDEILHSFNEGSRQIKIETEVSLRERETGYTFVLLESEKNTHFPFLQKYWDNTGPFLARPVGGESLLEIAEGRLSRVFAKIWRTYAGKKVWLVTHGRIIQCTRYLLDEMSLDQVRKFLSMPDSTPHNCSVMIYRYSPEKGKLVLEGYNKVFTDMI